MRQEYERFSHHRRVSDPTCLTCVTHVPWCMPGSLTSSFIWSRWMGKSSRHSKRNHNPQFYVSGMRPIIVMSHAMRYSCKELNPAAFPLAYRMFDHVTEAISQSSAITMHHSFASMSAWWRIRSHRKLISYRFARSIQTRLGAKKTESVLNGDESRSDSDESRSDSTVWSHYKTIQSSQLLATVIRVPEASHGASNVGLWWFPLRWRHNGCDSVSNHQPRECLLRRLIRRTSKKTSKLGVTGLCAGNSPETGEFPAQMTSNAEKFPFDDVIMSVTNLNKLT